MCGFVGFYSNKEYDKSVIENMSQKIEHRGPDSSGYFLDEKVKIGFRRLSFVDVKCGEQPISNENDDIVIVFNGEIYNYLNLRKDLIEKGYKFKTKTDTEVILLGYQEYGIEGILSKLRGMFAFTIYDKRENKIIGARDHFGIKPYYYCNYPDNSTFLFSSEIKSFLAFPDFKKEVNDRALKNYLVFQYNPLEETFFKNVMKLKAGHYFIYENGNLNINRFFKPEFDYIDESESEVVKRIDDAVQESVAAHKTGEFEIGSFLSGGVDSSYIVASTVPNKTFSVGFDMKGLDNPDFNETNLAKKLSSILNIENFSKTISKEEFFEGINKVQYFSDEPHANLSSVPLYFLSKLASEHVKVVYSGEGADELFGGYYEYYDNLLSRIYKKLPFSLRRYIYEKTKDKPHFKGQYIVNKHGRKVEDRFIGQAFIMDDYTANSLLKEKYKNNTKATDLTKKYFDDVKDMDDITKYLYLDMNMWLVEDILLKADKMTMANSLELRVPFLDIKMWDVARSIQPKYKVKNGKTKYAFRKASMTKIPEECSKRKKVGFVVPFSKWVKEEKYYNMIKDTFNEPFVDEFFDKDKILELLDKHYKGISNEGRKIYTIYTFLVWYKIYFLNDGLAA